MRWVSSCLRGCLTIDGCILKSKRGVWKDISIHGLGDSECRRAANQRGDEATSGDHFARLRRRKQENPDNKTAWKHGDSTFDRCEAHKEIWNLHERSQNKDVSRGMRGKKWLAQTSLAYWNVWRSFSLNQRSVRVIWDTDKQRFPADPESARWSRREGNSGETRLDWCKLRCCWVFNSLTKLGLKLNEEGKKIGEEEDRKVDEEAVMSKKIHEEIAKLSLICSEYNERLLLVREIKDNFAPFAMAVSN